MTQIKISKLISDDTIEHLKRAGRITDERHRRTGKTLASILHVIADAIDNPEVPQLLCGHNCEEGSGYMKCNAKMLIECMKLQHLNVIENSNGVFLVYDIYRTIEVDRS